MYFIILIFSNIETYSLYISRIVKKLYSIQSKYILYVEILLDIHICIYVSLYN